MSGSNRSASSARAAMSAHDAASARASDCSARYGAVSSKDGASVTAVTSGTLWLKVRPSSSAAMRVRWIAGVPPAMAQPCASRCRRSMPNSSL